MAASRSRLRAIIHARVCKYTGPRGPGARIRATAETQAILTLIGPSGETQPALEQALLGRTAKRTFERLPCDLIAVKLTPAARGRSKPPGIT